MEKVKESKFKQRLHKFFSPIDLTEGSSWRVLLKFSLPIIISYLLQQLYVLSDAAICGQTLSADEVAGVNDTSSLIFIFLQFAFGCTAGFCVILSNHFGAKDLNGVRRSFATQFILCSVITVILTAVSILCIKPMLYWINVTPQNMGVYKAAYTYCFVIFCGFVAQLFYNFSISVLRSVGDSVTPLAFLLASTILNVVLDIIFIKCFYWGVAGAAGATVLTQMLATIACFIYTFKKYKHICPTKEDFKLSLKEIGDHLKQGLPLGFQFGILSIGLIVMLSETVKFDILPDGLMIDTKPAQNGVGAANKLIEFAMAPLSAFGTAMVSFNAQNLGKGNYKRVKKGTNEGMIIVLILSVICAGVGLLLTINGAYQHIFLSEEKITDLSLHYGTVFLYIDFGLFPLLGLLFVWRNGVQGIGKSNWTLLAGGAELVARVLICMFLPSLFNGGPINANANYPAYIALCFGDSGAWILADVILIIPYIKYILKEDYRFLQPDGQTA